MPADGGVLITRSARKGSSLCVYKENPQQGPRLRRKEEGCGKKGGWGGAWHRNWL
ncbi:hypothetical protein PISMIDRAFT_683367 [Pisolithus microcarpus 441]|uniref:Uncharacterized protein n=1 Tax=Pisolithus microcarpus 441 TaxID=765257 RepID=A0A0C9Z9X0_9AGAM|nr:hypothetical protein PISMIDRAFT_683367 [Pisolithus microcarpus 441]